MQCPLYISRVSGYNFQKTYCIILSEDLFFTFFVDSTVCQNTCLGVSHIQRVNGIFARSSLQGVIYSMFPGLCQRVSDGSTATTGLKRLKT